MRKLILILSLLSSTSIFAQLREGFDPDEAKALIAMCNSYTFLELYGSDSSIIPNGYQKTYTSEAAVLDNMFQVYTNDKIGVINFRGSTSKFSSWVENIYSAMIPANGVIYIDTYKFPYSFAKDTSATVHSGYALALVIFSPILLDQIQKLNDNGIYDILITGHSQGGALANLCRAYLENLPEEKLSSKNKFKSYAFANPMIGNKNFADEFHERYCETNMSYSIINPADLVPKMPIHYQEEGRLMSFQHLQDVVFGKETMDIRKLGLDYVMRKFEIGLTNYINFSNELIEKLISNSYTSIVMPEYTKDINYYQTGNIRELEPFPYPKILIDTTQVSKEELEKLNPDKDGKYYRKEPSFFQHRPYNYYVAILKEYFSKEFKELDPICLPENL